MKIQPHKKIAILLTLFSTASQSIWSFALSYLQSKPWLPWSSYLSSSSSTWLSVSSSTDKAMKNSHKRVIFLHVTINIDEIIVEFMLFFWCSGQKKFMRQFLQHVQGLPPDHLFLPAVSLLRKTASCLSQQKISFSKVPIPKR